MPVAVRAVYCIADRWAAVELVIACRSIACLAENRKLDRQIPDSVRMRRAERVKRINLRCCCTCMGSGDQNPGTTWNTARTDERSGAETKMG